MVSQSTALLPLLLTHRVVNQGFIEPRRFVRSMGGVSTGAVLAYGGAGVVAGGYGGWGCWSRGVVQFLAAAQNPS